VSEEKEVYNLLRHALYHMDKSLLLPHYEEAKNAWNHTMLMNKIEEEKKMLNELQKRQRVAKEKRLEKLMLGNVRENFEKTGVVSGDSPLGSWTLCFGEMHGTHAKIDGTACFKLHDSQPIVYIFANPTDRAEYIRMIEQNRQSQGRTSPHAAVAIAGLPAAIVPLKAKEIFGRLKTEHNRFGGRPPGMSFIPLHSEARGNQPILQVEWRQPAK